MFLKNVAEDQAEDASSASDGGINSSYDQPFLVYIFSAFLGKYTLLLQCKLILALAYRLRFYNIRLSAMLVSDSVVKIIEVFVVFKNI